MWKTQHNLVFLTLETVDDVEHVEHVDLMHTKLTKLSFPLQQNLPNTDFREQN